MRIPSQSDSRLRRGKNLSTFRDFEGRVRINGIGTLRCVVVTDFEKTSSTALVEGIHDDEAGGAIGVFKALVDCEVGDQLGP